MLVDVIRLRDHGRRLRAPELAAPVRGELRVAEVPPGSTSFRRAIMAAHVSAPRGANGTMIDVLTPIFDVRLLVIEGDRLTITGTELATVPGPAGEQRMAEHQQVWRCTLVHESAANAVARTTTGKAATQPA